jgi:hypothetical protein
MNFFTWLTTKRKTLGTMTVSELRSQEMLLENERNRMQAKIDKLAREKSKIVERGGEERTPELRRAFAQQFDLLHTEQMMLSHHLNVRSKELLTVSRLRMLREMTQRRGLSSSAIVTIRESDLALIEKLIENDAVSTEVYQERLDEILQVGIQADEEAAGVSPAAQELMKIWNDMDAGLIKDAKSASDEAERRMREKKRAQPE